MKNECNFFKISLPLSFVCKPHSVLLREYSQLIAQSLLLAMFRRPIWCQVWNLGFLNAKHAQTYRVISLEMKDVSVCGKGRRFELEIKIKVHTSSMANTTTKLHLWSLAWPIFF